tara:strand:- start:35861 stop:37081 length:1221 start_codon:yes stop_codon:yes gene_type:complete
MKIKKCRVCNSIKLQKLFSLGNLSFTGKFTNSKNKNIKKDFISLVMCNACSLVQLDRNFNSNFLYGKDYGYRTGINFTMTNHVKNVVKQASRFVNLKKKDAVLDIASNDGTLLNFYKKDIITVGIDPILNKYKNKYKNINYKIPKFFNSKSIKRAKINKYKIITALSVFYDLKNPNEFIKNIKKILHRDGVFILEHADLLLILKNNLFDTICHEHLEYYSTKTINYILSKFNLKILKHNYNDINGGSSQYYIVHKDSYFKSNGTKIKKIIETEKKYGLNNKKTFLKFYKKILLIKKRLVSLLNKIKKNKKIIHGYGASTKGNVLLQFFGISKKHLDFIADRNIMKKNFYTPGTKIKIITEQDSRKLCPDYYLVLPWHFKKEILKREYLIRKKGTKFIFPLPYLKIY